MTVAELKYMLSKHNDDEEVLYFDSEMGEYYPMTSSSIRYQRPDEDNL